MQQPSQSNPQQELPSVKVDPQQSQSQPVFKIENNILLTLNHGEFIVMAMTESMIIDVARFLAQRFTADNARLAILGISEEQIFLSCLDQAISTLATGLGIVIYHRDPAKKNSPPNLVGAFTWCDGFISRYHTQLRWIKSKPAATEKMKLAKRIDEEFLGPIAFKIQEYLELNGMFQPNLVAHVLRAAVHPDFAKQKLLLVMSSLVSYTIVNLGYKMHVGLATHSKTGQVVTGLTGPFQYTHVVFSLLFKQNISQFVFSETKSRPFESLDPTVNAVVTLADYRGSSGEWQNALEYGTSSFYNDVPMQEVCSAINEFITNEYIPIQKQRKFWLDKLTAAVDQKESLEIVNQWISTPKSKL